MDWFERLTGFRETAYEDTRAKLEVNGRQLKSLVNVKGYGIGELELVSLQTLRDRVSSLGGPSGRLAVSVVTGDVGEMHRSAQYNGALFQVASQFNLLEMVSPDVILKMESRGINTTARKDRHAPSRPARPPFTATTSRR